MVNNFLYDNKVGSREEVKEVIDSMSQVATWRYDIPHCFYVISEYSAEELYENFIEHNGTKGRFMFIEANPNRQGQMLSETWHLLEHKKHKLED